MKSVLEQSHRWRSIQYEGQFSDAIVDAITRPTSMLENIKIGFTPIGGDVTSMFPDFLPLPCGGRVRHVQVRNALLPWASLSGLTTFTSATSTPR